ncbi:MAG: hypothetical protein NEHIOOID_00852 [Holosporales bacterium]
MLGIAFVQPTYAGLDESDQYGDECTLPDDSGTEGDPVKDNCTSQLPDSPVLTPKIETQKELLCKSHCAGGDYQPGDYGTKVKIVNDTMSIRSTVGGKYLARLVHSSTAKIRTENKNDASFRVHNFKGQKRMLDSSGIMQYATGNNEEAYKNLDQLGTIDTKVGNTSVWARPFYVSETYKDINAKNWGAGSLFGATYVNQDHFYSLGLILGFDFGKMNSNNSNGKKIRTNSIIYGLQASKAFWTNSSVDFLYLGSRSNLKIKREDAGRTASADTKKHLHMFDLQVSHYFALINKETKIGALLGHQMAYENVGSYKEQGGLFNQDVSKVKSRSADFYLGGRAVWSPKKSGDALAWKLKGEYYMYYKYKAKGSSFNISNAGHTHRFNYSPSKGLGHAIVLTAGIKKNEWVVDSSVNLMMAKKYTGFGLNLGLKRYF